MEKHELSSEDLDRVAAVFASIDDPHEMKQFLNEILTEHELINVTLRWKLLNMLEDDISQRTIASNLGISLCKITRGAKILKDDTSVIHKLITSKGEKDEWRNDEWRGSSATEAPH